MTHKQWLCLILATVMLFGLLLSGCKPGGSESEGSTLEKVTGEWALPEMDQLVGDTCTMLISNGEPPNSVYTDILKAEYGLTVEYIEAPWNERKTRLAAMVAAGSPPDIYGDKAELDLIVSNLIQPIDPYTDLSNKYYDRHRAYYDSNEWNGQHYGLYNTIMAVNTVYYNKKMFEDAGLETPWELYQQDKWDWNAFAEAAEELTQDTNDDGEVDVYGVCFNRPVCWPYTTGEPFATMDSETMKPVSNMDSENIARAMNFIYDLINVKNLGYKTADTIELFGSGGAAMMPQDSGTMYQYLTSMIEQDTLGIAPMPRDPNGDTYYARDMVGAYTIPVGAKNPQAAVALNACILYYEYYRENALDVKYQEIQETYKLSDELLEQLRVCHGEANDQPENIKGVQEYLENLGYNCTWETIYWGVPWATALENRKAEMESLIAATGEIIEASNSPKVEDFEAIPDGGITTPIVSKLTAVPGGSSGYELYLDTEVKSSGNYGGKMYYDVSDVGWGGFRKEFTRDWSEYNAMSLWVQGDGTKQLLTLTFTDGKNTQWHYDLEITGDTAQTYVIPFSDFMLPDYLEGESIDMDLSSITVFQLTVSGEGDYAGSHSFNVDDIIVTNAS